MAIAARATIATKLPTMAQGRLIVLFAFILSSNYRICLKLFSYDVFPFDLPGFVPGPQKYENFVLNPSDQP